MIKIFLIYVCMVKNKNRLLLGVRSAGSGVEFTVDTRL
jgi:hypothetical protein